MSQKRETEFSLVFSSLKEVITYAKTHRLLLTKPDGNSFINVSLLVAAIFVFLLPKVALIIAIIALFRETTLHIVGPEKAKNDDRNLQEPAL